MNAPRQSFIGLYATGAIVVAVALATGEWLHLLWWLLGIVAVFIDDMRDAFSGYAEHQRREAQR